MPLAEFRAFHEHSGNWTQIGSDLQVGITARWQAALLAVGLSLAAWWVLYQWARHRNILGSPFLSLVANKNGYASLSQFQVVLWTFTLAGGVIYVMALSGNLIDVPGQALMLLGISGVAALASAAIGTSPAGKGGSADSQAVPVAAAATDKRAPQWSDLVVWDGTNEIDVTRVQMLFFTLIAAFFVILDILNDRGIPKVPDGIVELLGVSNGIYVGRKYLGDRSTP